MFCGGGRRRASALQTVTIFVEHLEKIAEKASQLELQRFAPLLHKMEDTWGVASPSSPVSSASEQEEEGEESTSFDDDDSDEEDDDEETEEDQAFIDDDAELDEDDLSFYRRVDLERGLDSLPLSTAHRDPTPPVAPLKNGWQKKPNGS